MTHAELVERAARWLKGTAGCNVVLAEFVAQVGEIPDAIGWKSCESFLIECKTSRADFLADKKKPWRREPEFGMGVYRYFMAPAGIIKPEELPAGWGLLEVTERGGVRIAAGRHPKRWNFDACYSHKRHVVGEMSMLLSGLNRLRIRLGEADFRRLVHQPYSERQAELADTAPTVEGQ